MPVGFAIQEGCSVGSHQHPRATRVLSRLKLATQQDICAANTVWRMADNICYPCSKCCKLKRNLSGERTVLINEAAEESERNSCLENRPEAAAESCTGPGAASLTQNDGEGRKTQNYEGRREKMFHFYESSQRSGPVAAQSAGVASTEAEEVLQFLTISQGCWKVLDPKIH